MNSKPTNIPSRSGNAQRANQNSCESRVSEMSRTAGQQDSRTAGQQDSRTAGQQDSRTAGH